MACKNNKKLIRVNLCNPWTLFSFLISILLFSCTSTPKQFDALLQKTHLPLDTGAAVYILANVAQARPILEILPIEELQDEQTLQLLDRTNFIAAALFPQESGRRFQLAAWGNYPSTRAGMALGSNRYWEKYTTESGETYWYAEIARLSIAMEAKQAFAVSHLQRNQHNNPRATPPGVPIPNGFSEFVMDLSGRHAVPLSLWMNNPGPALADMLANAGIPIRIPVRQLFINFYPMPNGECEALIRMLFLNEASARGTVNMISFASALSPADMDIASIFLANPPVQRGNVVDVRTARLSREELQKLLALMM